LEAAFHRNIPQIAMTDGSVREVGYRFDFN
jgi:hypothetical protein